MPRKKKPFLLANNPKDDNSCQCFSKNLPSADWIVIARYATMKQCNEVANDCSAFFMMNPIRKPSRRMMMG